MALDFPDARPSNEKIDAARQEATMAQIFLQDSADAWAILSLDDRRYRLASACGRRHSDSSAQRPARGQRPPEIFLGGRLSRSGALLLRHQNTQSSDGRDTTSAPSEDWALLAGPDARLLLNGMPLSLGIAVLHHGDEICFEDGAPIYLSTERRACVETYSASDAPDCPRCASPIAQGDSVVVCPNCSVIYHQRSDRGCFTYSESCALCDQPSDLTAELCWTPEGI
jgi:hypothetical protein